MKKIHSGKIRTIGYGNRAISDFILLLKHFKIEFLIDVRSSPYSRYSPDFSKAPLKASLSKIGIRYLFMGDSLGGTPDDSSVYTNGKADYDKLKEKDYFLSGIARIERAINRQFSLVLMCSEAKPEMCHRTKLISEVMKSRGHHPEHIDEQGKIISHEEAIARVFKGQLSLFGPNDRSFKSRRRIKK